MLNICGNFVPILISIICCAGLFMYFNLRLAEIKVAVEKQNRVLTAFITNVQQDIRSGGNVMPVPFGVGMNHLAAPEALIAAQKFGNDKIVVSDDEDSDSDDSDSESDTDDEDECEEVPESVVVSIINIQEINHTPSIPISFEDLSCLDKIDGDNEKAFESSITEIIDLSAGLVDTSVVDTTTYDQMKVDELRKIVTDKNMVSKEEVKKLKKTELLLLLKK